MNDHDALAPLGGQGSARAKAPMVSNEDARLMVQIGMSAAMHGHAAKARQLFELLSVHEPVPQAIAVGHALCFLGEGQPREAVQRLRMLEARAGERAEEIRCFLLLALCLAGDTAEAQRLRNLLLQQGSDHAKAFVRHLFGETPAKAGAT